MKMLLKVIAAPFALALALLSALCWFLFALCAFFLTIASVIVAVLGICLFFYAYSIRRGRVPVPCFSAFPVWIAGGSRDTDLGAGWRQICSVQVSCKLNTSTSGHDGPKPGRRLISGRFFFLEKGMIFWQRPHF